MKVFDYQCQIHEVDENGNIIQTLAQLNGFGPAKAAFEAYAVSKSHCWLQFRERMRVVETVRTGAYDMETGKVEIVERSV